MTSGELMRYDIKWIDELLYFEVKCVDNITGQEKGFFLRGVENHLANLE